MWRGKKTLCLHLPHLVSTCINTSYWFPVWKTLILKIIFPGWENKALSRPVAHSELLRIFSFELQSNYYPDLERLLVESWRVLYSPHRKAGALPQADHTHSVTSDILDLAHAIEGSMVLNSHTDASEGSKASLNTPLLKIFIPPFWGIIVKLKRNRATCFNNCFWFTGGVARDWTVRHEDLQIKNRDGRTHSLLQVKLQLSNSRAPALRCHYVTIRLQVWERPPHGAELDAPQLAHASEKWENVHQDFFGLQAHKRAWKSGRQVASPVVPEQHAERLQGPTAQFAPGLDTDLSSHGLLYPALGKDGSSVHPHTLPAQTCVRPNQHISRRFLWK